MSVSGFNYRGLIFLLEIFPRLQTTWAHDIVRHLILFLASKVVELFHRCSRKSKRVGTGSGQFIVTVALLATFTRLKSACATFIHRHQLHFESIKRKHTTSTLFTRCVLNKQLWFNWFNRQQYCDVIDRRQKWDEG